MPLILLAVAEASWFDLECWRPVVVLPAVALGIVLRPLLGFDFCVGFFDAFSSRSIYAALGIYRAELIARRSFFYLSASLQLAGHYGTALLLPPCLLACPSSLRDFWRAVGMALVL